MTSFYKLLLTILLFLFVCLPLLLPTRYLLLTDPPVWPDEPIFVSIAQNFASSASLNTDIHGVLGSNLSNVIYGYPPLYFYALGTWIKFFGSSIESIRFFPLITSVLTLGLFFLITLKITNNKLLSFFAVFLLSLNSQYAQSSRIARMEILVIFFTLLSLFFTLLAQNRKKTSLYLITGIFCTLSLLTHPIGIIAAIVNSIFILVSPNNFKTKLRSLFSVIIPVALGFCLWLISIQSNLTPLLSDLQKHLNRKNSLEPYLFTLIKNDLTFRIVFLAQLLTFVGLIIFYLKTKTKQLSLFLPGPLLVIIGSIASLGLIIYGKEMWYIVYFIPFATLALILLLDKFLLLKNKIYAFVLIALLNTPFILNLYQLNSNYQNNFYRDYHMFASRVSELVGDNSPVCLSSIPDPYFTLIKNPKLKVYEFIYLDFDPIKRKSFLDSCNSLVINYPVDQYSMEYIDRNIARFIEIKDPANYSTYIVVLKDKKDRL